MLKAMDRPNMMEPMTIANARSMVESARPSSSNTADAVKIVIMIRTAELSSRGDGMSVLTAQSRAAREKKLAASKPKKRKNRATTKRGRKTKKRVTYSSRPRMPSALTPSRTKPSQAIQKAKRLTSSVDDGS